MDTKLVFLFHQSDGNADVYINTENGTEMLWGKYLENIFSVNRIY